MTRKRTNSHSATESSQLENDRELQRRRIHRQMSEALDRFGRLSQGTGSESSAPPLSLPTSFLSSLDAVQDVTHMHPPPQAGTLHTIAYPTPHQARALQINANPPPPQPRRRPQTRADWLGDYGQRRAATRSRSDDGQHFRAALRRDIFRNLRSLQDQLDTVRSAQAANPSEEAQHRLAVLQANINQERAAIESEWGNEYAPLPETDNHATHTREEEPSVSGMRNSPNVYTRRRAAMHDADMARYSSPALYDPTWATTSSDRLLVDEENKNKPVTAAFVYSNRSSRGSECDIWPDIRDRKQAPARYVPVELHRQARQSGPPTRPIAEKLEKAILDCYDTGSKFKDERLDDQYITWPTNELPSEIYHLIADTLSRDDIKSMRLACKEFEHHLSGNLFRNVVVPFNTEIYGMVQSMSSSKRDSKGRGKGKGKGKARAITPVPTEFWKNAKKDEIYTGHGVDVFRSFGPRMRRFGMSFEVDEEVLAKPPVKGLREDHKSYWGIYQWPYPEYRRFDLVAGLEDAADETPKMKTAFSFLTEVRELALTLDSGLGWLCGPDRSIRATIFHGQRRVFGTKRAVPDRRRQAQQCLWDFLKARASVPTVPDLRLSKITSHNMSDPITANLALDHEFVTREELSVSYVDVQNLIDPVRSTDTLIKNLVEAGDGRAQASTPAYSTNPDLDKGDDHAFDGGVIIVKEDTVVEGERENYPLVPNELSKLQKEWLLETEWAQRAFLSSWLIAIVDNKPTFQHVHTINLASMSSRFLPSLTRDDFWTALPKLKNVTLHVNPDCRDVLKDNAGFVEMPAIPPMTVIHSLQKLVNDVIATRSTIKCLNIGWTSGGEHAQGLTARNKHLWPAPILPAAWLGNGDNLFDEFVLEANMVKCPHLLELTLKNCWISPHALVHLVKEHEDLESLCLDSVSLTAKLKVGDAQNAQLIPVFAQSMHAPLPPAPIPADFPNMDLHAASMGVFPFPIHPALAHQPHVPFSNAWIGPHREGSWPHVLDTVSPGITLVASGSSTSPKNIPSTTPTHNLRKLVMKSCGYCRLNNPRLDEADIPLPVFGNGGPYFSQRYKALIKYMIPMNVGGLLAHIVQAIPTEEQDALAMGFDLSLGWPEEWAAEVEAPTFDACLPGGTGRFSGSIAVESRVALPEEIGV